MTEAVGFFRPGAGWLHRLNPYPKLLVLVWGVLAPWKKSYANSGGQVCPVITCGSADVHSRGQVRQTPKFQFTCRVCGHWWTAKP